MEMLHYSKLFEKSFTKNFYDFRVLLACLLRVAVFLAEGPVGATGHDGRPKRRKYEHDRDIYIRVIK
ncbi:hypothetical protein KUA02_13820 [Komagataeibacter pomaceti]|nr:hypothetical protein [Novacetimonas pomaceti]